MVYVKNSALVLLLDEVLLSEVVAVVFGSGVLMGATIVGAAMKRVVGSGEAVTIFVITFVDVDVVVDVEVECNVPRFGTGTELVILGMKSMSTLLGGPAGSSTFV